MTTTATPTHVAHRRAKIVCTLGPATEHRRLADLSAAGMDVARLNFSHGDHADHQRHLRPATSRGRSIGQGRRVLADLQGPKIRLGRFADGPHDWPTGDRSPSPSTTSPAPGTGCPPPTGPRHTTPAPATGC